MRVSRSKFRRAINAGIDNANARVGLKPREVQSLLEVAENATACRVGIFGHSTDAPENQCPWVQAGLLPRDPGARHFYRAFDPHFTGSSHLTISRLRFWE